MKIKKILIGTSSIGIIAIPITGAFMHSNNIKNFKSDEKSHYDFSGGIAKDRTYKMELSFFETKQLAEEIKLAKTIVAKGDAMYGYLANDKKYAYDTWTYGTNFYKDLSDNGLMDWNDTDSARTLFEMKNSHNWKSGFNMTNFEITINKFIFAGYAISMTLWVDYKFLAHDLYGLTYKNIV